MDSLFAAIAAVAALGAVIVASVTVRQGRQASRDNRHLRKVEQLDRIADLLVELVVRPAILPNTRARLQAALAALEALGGPALETTPSFLESVREPDIGADAVVNPLNEVERVLRELPRPKRK